MAARRVLSLLFPWYVLWRIRTLAETPFLYPTADRDRDVWDSGYERAMYEVLLNLGRAEPS